MEMPDFVIVGAPKCGTTALYRYLSEHPLVFMPQIKEPHFFSSDLKGIARVGDIKAYSKLFRPAAPGQRRGEASATYLFSKVALRDLMAAQPRARIIVMLRDPVEAARSYHAQMLKGLIEDIEDFEEAWRAQPDRLAGRRIPATCPDPALLQYGPTFEFADQLERAMGHVPPAQLHVILYEELFADPRAHYAALLDFLGLPSDGRRDFPVFNARKALKNRRLASLYLKPPALLRRLWAPVRPLAHALGVHTPEILQRLNTEPATQRPLSPSFEAELRAHFEPHNRALEKLLGRPLDQWGAR